MADNPHARQYCDASELHFWYQGVRECKELFLLLLESSVFFQAEAYTLTGVKSAMKAITNEEFKHIWHK